MGNPTGQKNDWVLRVACPKCGVPAGVACYIRRGDYRSFSHALRRYAAQAAGLMPEVKIYGLRTKREPYFKKKIPGTGAPHEEGWSSKSCQKRNHAMCFARQCACFCHNH